ncbi:MAG: hypothetical protein ACQEQL_02915 [Pseudomonadota bacterium]
MGKSACPVDEKKRHKFLHDNGFRFARTGKGSHQIWAHQQTGESITLCSNPAKGTWRQVEKQVMAIAEKQHKAEMAQNPAAKQKAKEEYYLQKAFKKVACKFAKLGRDVDFTFEDFKKRPERYRNAAFK